MGPLSHFTRRVYFGDIIAIFALLFLAPLYLVNLGGFGLADYDEAWYAVIAGNIVLRHDFLHLVFNGNPYIDHPPLGFLLMALASVVFGFNEFSARLPSALLGIGSLIVLYLIGKNLFNRTVGFCAALILSSSVWFVFRARSGNLDSVFIFFYLLTFYFAIRAVRIKKFLLFTGVSLGLLLMVKTIIGITVLLPIVIFWWREKAKLNIKYLASAGLLCLVIILPWLVANYLAFGDGFLLHLYSIGLRPSQHNQVDFAHILSSQTANYLHYGIRQWYYPALVAFVGLIVAATKQAGLLSIYALLGFLLWGFLSNTKTEIWHLLPVYPFFALLIAYFLREITGYIGKFLPRPVRPVAVILAVMIVAGFAAKQVYGFKDEVHLFDKGTSDLATVAKVAKNRSEPLYLGMEDLFPSVVYYAQKNVRFIRAEKPPLNSLPGVVASGQKPLLLLTEQWRLDTDKVSMSGIEVLARSGDKLLLLVR